MAITENRTLSILAPAKINLYLHVTGRREDGYHTLDSLVAFADTGDRIGLQPGRGFSFQVDGPYARSFTAAELDGGPCSRNLAVRAARALAAAAGRDPDIRLRLTKNLPLAAGVGGGSADAAATIHGLMELWGLARQFSSGLDDLLLALGADVPACMVCAPVRMGGIGEETSLVDDFDEIPAVLVNPGKPCPTASVFAAYEGPFSAPAPAYDWRDRAGMIEFLKGQRNDLTQAAGRIVPAIPEALELIAAQQGCLLSRLSGSGATCFGLFSDEMETLDAAERILATHPGWWVRACVLGRPGRY